MLSQLMSGRRAKIGHPMVVRRVQALNELAAAAAEGRLATETLERRLEEIQAATGAALTGGTSSVVTISEPSAQPTNGTVTRARDVVRAVQDLLRAVTSAERLLAAVRQLEPEHPELAEFLRVYGAGRTAEALAHYERLQSEL